MIKVGITGSKGFVGYHLYHTLALHKDEFSLIEFDRSLYGNGSFQRSAIVLDSEFSVVVNSNSGNTIFNVYGFEE